MTASTSLDCTTVSRLRRTRRRWCGHGWTAAGPPLAIPNRAVTSHVNLADGSGVCEGYMDGGIRSATNADLAAGSSAVVVLNAIGHLTPRELLQEELATLGAAATLVITPDDTAAAVMGTNLLDAAIAAPVLEAGLAQAVSCSESAHSIWQAT